MAGKNFKNVDKYWGIWYSVLYGMQEIRWINFNMGCFEIYLPRIYQIRVLRLTLTWDVLKFEGLNLKKLTVTSINFNMGCFEIGRFLQRICKYAGINFNMGCFEINARTNPLHTRNRLTLTWDVLK